MKLGKQARKLTIKLKKFVKNQPIYGFQYKDDKKVNKALGIKHHIFYSKSRSLNYLLDENSWIVSNNPNFINDIKHSDIWVVDNDLMKKKYKNIN